MSLRAHTAPARGDPSVRSGIPATVIATGALNSGDESSTAPEWGRRLKQGRARRPGWKQTMRGWPIPKAAVAEDRRGQLEARRGGGSIGFRSELVLWRGTWRAFLQSGHPARSQYPRSGAPELVQPAQPTRSRPRFGEQHARSQPPPSSPSSLLSYSRNCQARVNPSYRVGRRSSVCRTVKNVTPPGRRRVLRQEVSRGIVDPPGPARIGNSSLFA
jgi:hypothetical protein